MKYELDDILVSCLRSTLRVLLVSSDKRLVAPIVALAKRFPVVHIQTVGGNDAVRALQGSCPPHALILDNRDSDAFGVLSHFENSGSWIPLILLSDPARESAHQTIDDVWNDIGARPSAPVSSGRFDRIHTVRADDIRAVFQTTVVSAMQTRLIGRIPSPDIRKSFEVLFSRHPVTVDSWANLVGLSPRAFLRRFAALGMPGPKKILSLYHAYKIGLEKLDAPQGVLNSCLSTAYIIDAHSRNRVMEYVLSRKASMIGPSPETQSLLVS